MWHLDYQRIFYIPKPTFHCPNPGLCNRFCDTVTVSPVTLSSPIAYLWHCGTGVKYEQKKTTMYLLWFQWHFTPRFSDIYSFLEVTGECLHPTLVSVGQPKTSSPHLSPPPHPNQTNKKHAEGRTLLSSMPMWLTAVMGVHGSLKIYECHSATLNCLMSTRQWPASAQGKLNVRSQCFTGLKSLCLS